MIRSLVKIVSYSAFHEVLQGEALEELADRGTVNTGQTQLNDCRS
jgi:hypothetical protein